MKVILKVKNKIKKFDPTKLKIKVNKCNVCDQNNYNCNMSNTKIEKNKKKQNPVKVNVRHNTIDTTKKGTTIIETKKIVSVEDLNLGNIKQEKFRSIRTISTIPATKIKNKKTNPTYNS